MRLRDLGTHKLTWRDMYVIVRQSPKDSALIRSIAGDQYEWFTTNQLLALIADALHVANWQRSDGKRADFPQPIPRPGVEAPRRRGRQAVSMDEMRERLERKKRMSAVPN